MSYSDVLEKAKKALHKKKKEKEGSSHDAMFHHCLHAQAAGVAGKKDEAKKHTFMFMRHALENSRDYNSPHSMVDGVKRNLEHYQSESDKRANYFGDRDKKDDLKEHFEGGGKYVPHEDDKELKEDYADEDGPDGDDDEDDVSKAHVGFDKLVDKLKSKGRSEESAKKIAASIAMKKKKIKKAEDCGYDMYGHKLDEKKKKAKKLILKLKSKKKNSAMGVRG